MQRAAVNLSPVIERERRRGGGCEIPAFVEGQLVTCRGEASIRCACCHRRSCLGHSFVSHQAEAICWKCVQRAVREWSPPPPPPPRQGGKRYGFDEVRDAREILGVDALATGAEVKKAFRLKMRKMHPDLHRDPKAKATAEEKSVRITAAYKVLQDTENGSSMRGVT